MSLFKYEVLNTVVKLGSLTKAAAALNLTQSGVSHAISSLEAELGVSLLSRDRSGIRLTSSGNQLLFHMRDILNRNDILKQAAASIKGLESGTVTIGTFTSVSVQWLPDIIKRFQTDYPSIEIQLMEGRYNDIRNWLTEGDVDLGFLSSQTATNFDFIPLKNDKIVCLLPGDHPLCNQDKVFLEQIKNEPLITSSLGKTDDFKDFFKKLDPQNIKYETTGPATVIAMVQHGFGISFLPELALYQPLFRVQVAELAEFYYRVLGIAVPSLNSLSPATEKFIFYIKTWLKEYELLDY